MGVDPPTFFGKGYDTPVEVFFSGDRCIVYLATSSHFIAGYSSKSFVLLRFAHLGVGPLALFPQLGLPMTKH